MTARCSEVLSPSPEPPGVKFLRIGERVEGFFLQRLDERGESLGDLQFETMDEAMHHVYSKYHEISDWRFCPDDTDGEPPGRSLSPQRRSRGDV
jgi:hypothetical protein